MQIMVDIHATYAIATHGMWFHKGSVWSDMMMLV